MLRDLPQGDRAGHVRRQGSVVTIDLEALTRKRGTEIVCRHHCGCDVHASTQWKAESHTSISPEQITAERQREESS